MNLVKDVKSVLARANKILNQALNMHIQNHLVVRKHSIFLFLCTRLISVSFDVSSIPLRTHLHPSLYSCNNSLS